MRSSGFTNAPLSRLLVISTVTTAFLATLTDSKPYLPIQPDPHLFSYHQFWRLFTWQICYTNSTEVLFASMTFYQLRVIERLWGSRKFASFILSTFLYTTLLPPILLTVVLRPMSFGRINHLPSGPTPILFALLAQYHAAIPYIYKYRVSASTPAEAGGQDRGLMLTSKSTSYLLPLQLALSQFPGSALAAAVGWVIGFAYRREILPGAARWRVPGWVLGEGEERKERYDSLRRRMEGEAGRSTGAEDTRDQTRRRGMMGGLVDQFRGGN